MTINPYQILGVKKSANQEEIKEAYYRLAKTVHPDVGGGAEEFVKIKQAYDILSDPQARAAFDNEGYIRGDEESEFRRFALNELCNIWNEMFSQIPQERLPYINVVTIMRETVASIRKKAEREIDHIESKEKQLKKSRETITLRLKKKKKTSPNLFFMVIDRQIEAIAAEKKNAENRKKIATIGLDMLKEYEFSADKEDMTQELERAFTKQHGLKREATATWTTVFEI